MNLLNAYNYSDILQKTLFKKVLLLKVLDYVCFFNETCATFLILSFKQN